ncbi:unnamed protein product, partial [marine sediment metagenome]
FEKNLWRWAKKPGFLGDRAYPDPGLDSASAATAYPGIPEIK